MDRRPVGRKIPSSTEARQAKNTLRELLKVRQPDMLGRAQWIVMRAGRVTRVDVLHQGWLQQFHARAVALMPGDSLDCTCEETVSYDGQQNEVKRRLAIIEVHAVVSPPDQKKAPIESKL